MKPVRFVVLFALLAGLTMAQCKDNNAVTTVTTDPSTATSTTATPAPVASRFEKYRVPMKPGHKWIVQDIAATTKLLDCPDESKPGEVGAPMAAPAPGTGGFVCSTVWRVELLVKLGDNTVYVDPVEKLPVEVGDCILWEAKTASGDTTPAGVSLINFIDTAAEAPAGKATPMRASDHPVGRDFCKRRNAMCVMQIDLPVGTYRYEARVHHENKDKSTDPETEVSCTNCDPPTLTSAGGS